MKPKGGWKMTLAEGPSEILRSVATLAAAASHDINNPLMVIVGNLALVERTQTRDADGRVPGSGLAAADEIKERIRPPMLDLEKSSVGANGER
jgi:signal transduction histidine kinase